MVRRLCVHDKAAKAKGLGDVIERAMAEHLIHELHAARVRGDLESMCRLFAPRGRFRIAGASADKPISINADSLAGFRPWLSMMVKVFRLDGYELASLIVDDTKAAAQWRTDIYSKVTGVTVATDLVDILEVGDGHIVAYTEFFVPRLPSERLAARTLKSR